MKKLTSKQTIAALLGLTAIGFVVIPKLMGSSTPSTNTNTDTPPNTNTGSKPPVPSVSEILQGVSAAAYLYNLVTKGKSYADMQKYLQSNIAEGGNKSYANYTSIMVLSSANNLNLRKSPGSGGIVIKQVSKDEGIGKTTGRFYKSGGLIWAEITLIPPFVKIPYPAVNTAFVALGYLKSNQTINNTISGLAGLGCCSTHLSGFNNLIN